VEIKKGKRKKLRMKKSKRKKKRKIGGKKRRVLWTFDRLIHITQVGEAVLPNVFLKRIQLLRRIHFINTATVGTATAGAGALPNAPLEISRALQFSHLVSHSNITLFSYLLFSG
jgi:hypothetical protein